MSTKRPIQVTVTLAFTQRAREALAYDLHKPVEDVTEEDICTAFRQAVDMAWERMEEVMEDGA